TPIADARAIFRRIDPEVKRRFRELGVLYVRNFGTGPGMSWTTAFQTEDRADVERYCAAAGIEAGGKPDGGLRTRHVCPAITRHPATGDEIWFNHTAFFHVTTLPATIRDVLIASYGPEDLPTNTFYGDGSPIEDEVLDHLRACYRAETVAFAWQR